MKLTRYFPDSNDHDLLDFVNDITVLVNEGRFSNPTGTSAPTATANASEGEKRLVKISTYDVRDYSLVDGTWYYSQVGRPCLAGWGYIEATATASVTKAVSFGVTFDSPPFVIVSYIGVKTSSGAPSAPEDFTNANTLRIAAGYAPSTTGFSVAIYTGNGANLTAGQFEGFAWQAFYD